MEELIEKLDELGFNENDAKVYITLLELGKSNASKISKKTNIVRPRVYDALKRLEKRGYVEREAVQRAPKYSAVSPNIVFTDIKHKLTKKLSISEQISEYINEKVKISPNEGPWAIKGTNRIKSKIENLFLNTNNELLALITPDYNKDSIKWINDLILQKKEKSLKISIGMKIKEEIALEIKELIKNEVKIYHWHFTEEIPIGIYSSDSKNTLITVIGSWKKYIQHDIGFLIEGPPIHHKGFEFLIQWFFSACTKGEDRIKELEGD